jgi:hypothetical protein
MIKITDYQVVSSSHTSDLSEKVDHSIGDGWQPYGSPMVTSSEREGTIFNQAIVKYEEENHD